MLFQEICIQIQKCYQAFYRFPEEIYEVNSNIYFTGNLDSLLTDYLNSKSNEVKERIIIECLIKSKIANISKETMKANITEIEKELLQIINIQFTHCKRLIAFCLKICYNIVIFKRNSF